MCKKVNNHKISNTRIDKCMQPLIKYLNQERRDTVACCCGHGKYPMTIVIKWNSGKYIHYQELLTSTILKRTRNFYKRDNQGYYFIPEVK